MSAGLEPLPGAASGETFLSEAGGERVVVRIYGGRSVARGHDAPEVDAALLGWVAGLLPVASVLEVRPGDAAADVPGLLVTSFLPGVPLSAVLPTLDADGLRRVGASLGVLMGRLAHVAVPRQGTLRLLAGRDLVVEPLPAERADLPALVEDAGVLLGESGWSASDLAALEAVALDAQSALDTVARSCLVHGDLGADNVLVDPGSLAVTGLVDWEVAHAGSPYTDLGRLLRHDRDPVLVEAVLDAREGFVPDPRRDALHLARCADLVALVDRAGRTGGAGVTDRTDALLRAITATGDVHALAHQRD